MIELKFWGRFRVVFFPLINSYFIDFLNFIKINNIFIFPAKTLFKPKNCWACLCNNILTNIIS